MIGQQRRFEYVQECASLRTYGKTSVVCNVDSSSRKLLFHEVENV